MEYGRREIPAIGRETGKICLFKESQELLISEDIQIRVMSFPSEIFIADSLKK
jgi:hypothetical protein